MERAAEQGKLATAQIAELRQQKAEPILKKIHGQLESLKDETPPRGLLGKAAGYVTGMAEGLCMAAISSAKPFPIMIPYRLTNEQMCAVVGKYLDEHPEQWNEPAAGIVIKAFKAAWPCKK